jgi:hypothetical protein
LFESADNQTLTLSLDEQFSTLLTNSIQVTIQAKLRLLHIVLHLLGFFHHARHSTFKHSLSPFFCCQIIMV